MRILLFPPYFQDIENYTPIEDDLQQRKRLTSLNKLTLQSVAPTDEVEEEEDSEGRVEQRGGIQTEFQS